MAHLATEFSMPDASFDPYKYASKAVRAARDANLAKKASESASATATLPSVAATKNGTIPISAAMEENWTGTPDYNGDSFEDNSDWDTMPRPVAGETPNTTEDKPVSTETSLDDESMPEYSTNPLNRTPSSTQQYADTIQAFAAPSEYKPGEDAIEQLQKMNGKIDQIFEIMSQMSEQIKKLGNIEDDAGTVEQPASANVQVSLEDSKSVTEVNIERPTTPEEPSTTPEITQTGSVEVAAEDTKHSPATLLTVENFSLDSIPAPSDEDIFDWTPDPRRLVSIRRIQNICQVKVKNRYITVAQIDGWTCLVPRHAFREGDLVVFVMIDSFLPTADKRFGHMVSLQTYNGILGHRVKTQRFGAYPSKLEAQGRLYSLETFREIDDEIKAVRQVLNCMHAPDEQADEELTSQRIVTMYRHKDWAKELNVLKWVEPAPVSKPGAFPKLGAIPTRVFRKTDISHFEVCISCSETSAMIIQRTG